jgi:hypothetical protein
MKTNPKRVKTLAQRKAFALIGAIGLTLAGSLLVTGAIVYTYSNQALNQSRTDSEAALLLAEAGVNDELNFIQQNLFSANWSGRSSAPIKATGQPYAGRKGQVKDVPGDFWVYTSSDEAGTTAWAGQGAMYVTANAKVGGAWRKVQIQGPIGGFAATGGNPGPSAPTMGQSIFGDFTIFGYDSNSNGNQPCLGIIGSSNVTVVGNVGVNSRVQSSGVISYTKGYNYNTAGTSHAQLGVTPLFSDTQPFRFPTIRTIIKQTYAGASGYTEPWDYIKATYNNSGAKQWKSGMMGGAALTPSNVVSAGYPATGSDSVALVNKKGNTDGRWEGLNPKPGTTVKQLILPPGDYYFETLQLLYNANTELVIDNAGLSVGGNPNKTPVRFWINGSQGGGADYISCPISLTDPSDASTFRIYFGKDNGEFEFDRDANFPSGTDYSVVGCVYAVNQEWQSTTSSTKIDFIGGNSASKRIRLKGSLIADRVEFNGYCYAEHAGPATANASDPILGVGYAGKYKEF